MPRNTKKKKGKSKKQPPVTVANIFGGGNDGDSKPFIDAEFRQYIEEHIDELPGHFNYEFAKGAGDEEVFKILLNKSDQNGNEEISSSDSDGASESSSEDAGDSTGPPGLHYDKGSDDSYCMQSDNSSEPPPLVINNSASSEEDDNSSYGCVEHHWTQSFSSDESNVSDVVGENKYNQVKQIIGNGSGAYSDSDEDSCGPPSLLDYCLDSDESSNHKYKRSNKYIETTGSVTSDGSDIPPPLQSYSKDNSLSRPNPVVSKESGDKLPSNKSRDHVRRKKNKKSSTAVKSYNLSHEFHKTYYCMDDVSTINTFRKEYNFDVLASFVKFPPLGILSEKISILRDFVNHGILDSARKNWATRRLQGLANLHDAPVDEKIFTPKLTCKGKKQKEEILKKYTMIIPGGLNKVSISILFHLEKCDEISMDRLIARMHQEPEILEHEKMRIKCDKEWRKSLLKHKSCTNCGKKEENEVILKFCTSCFQACYCSQKCQRLHWKKHSLHCELVDYMPASFVREREEKLIREREEKKLKEVEKRLERDKIFASLCHEFLLEQLETPSKNALLQELSLSEVVVKLFDTSSKERLWLHLPDTKSAAVFKLLFAKQTLLDKSTQIWLEMESEKLLAVACEEMRRNEMTELVAVNVPVRPVLLQSLFGKISEQNDFMNKLCCDVKIIQLDKKSQKSDLVKASMGKLSKKARKHFNAALNNGDIALKQRSKIQTVVSISESRPAALVSKVETVPTSKQKKRKAPVPQYRKDFYSQFDDIIRWYEKFLVELRESAENGGHSIELNRFLKSTDGKDSSVNESQDTKKLRDIVSLPRGNHKPNSTISDTQAVEEMTKCLSVESEEDQDIIVDRLARNISLDDWGEGDDSAEWVVEITDEAFKWFKRNNKKSKVLVSRVLGRLKLLSTGRWPYVLKKPLKTRSNKVKLYESKIDSGSRIIWEIAVTFSPRRSSASESFCEQVVRVWDIVVDHDNLTRAIDLTVERIERSHKRGEECMIYSNLDTISPCILPTNNSINTPSIFRMTSGMKTRKSMNIGKSEKDTYYPPASHDIHEYTLLKFYALNTAAVKQLLSSDNNTLPFTPGPTEFEIIQHESTPPKSILLMGRSGTGKTTCLVFRMWSQFMAYSNAPKGSPRPRQLFLTTNPILRNEVKKAFLGMGSLWKKDTRNAILEGKYMPKFLSSAEWLELLDKTLPGVHFFSKEELELRSTTRSEDEFINQINTSLMREYTSRMPREQMNYSIFRKLWPKINSRVGCDYDPALVYVEIKSFIKGSVFALHLEVDDDSKVLNYLTKEEYLNLPRKMSRIGEGQRTIIYNLFVRYEQLKKEGNYYDEMDIVYNLARRAKRFHEKKFATSIASVQATLPIDSIFVDEVQDFTQAELLLLLKLSRDPNNLMLAGDTAQSIAVGVGFRFIDVRQIFYEQFDCAEPALLQLVHNYRSHGGILKLAASVVELLYFFFNDSLDTLPPDQGLFHGPKPVFIKVAEPAELVFLMNGSKRNDTRIEFGASQVILVRNEEAKSKIPEELISDRDWIMTVQEAKGLEFDDVLIYNFFTDSDAGDLWRVISNYTENDAKEFYEKLNLDLSGTKSFQWCELENLKPIRHLEFQRANHKVLESELKILYTAITRARVNVFIVEDDEKLSKPMYNYFLKRGVVDFVDKDTKDFLSKVNVFGKSDSSPEEWLKRGEMFLRNAESTRKRARLLRLASKCFSKAGDKHREKMALAYLAYAELEEEKSNYGVSKRKPTMQDHKQVYNVALKLLDAHDEKLLAKAGRCIMQVGEFEGERCARALALSAKLSYAKRQVLSYRSDTKIQIMLDEFEEQNFRLAGKLLVKSLSDNFESSSEERRRNILLAIHCNLANLKDIDLFHLKDLFSNYIPDIYHLVPDLGKLLKLGEEESNLLVTDHLRYFQLLMKTESDQNPIKLVYQIITSTIEEACFYFMKENNRNALRSCLDAFSTSQQKQDMAKKLGITILQ